MCAAERDMLDGKAELDFDFVAYRAQFAEQMEQAINATGVFIQYVDAEPPARPWAYTIGRTRRRLPELLVTGTCPTTAAMILNCVNEVWTDGSRTAADVTSHLDLSSPVLLLPIPDEVWDDSDFLLGAARDAEQWGLTDEQSAFQVVYADRDKNFPWHPACSAWFRRGQPILGRRER